MHARGRASPYADVSFAPAPGSSVCSCSPALTNLPPSSCRHTGALFTQASASISSSVARFLGLTSSILPMTCLLSRGSSRSSRHGPLITCGCCGASDAVDAVSGRDPSSVRVGGSDRAPWPSAADLCEATRDAGAERGAVAASISSLDLCRARSSSGLATKSLYELSDSRGAFHGKRRRDMQQNMMAIDHTSVGWGSYLDMSYTSGAR